MLRRALLLGLFVLSFRQAFAEAESKNRINEEPLVKRHFEVEEKVPTTPNGVSFYLMYSMANEFEIDGSGQDLFSAATIDVSGREISDSAIGIGFEAIRLRPKKWGYNSGASLEFPRKITKFKGQVNGTSEDSVLSDPISFIVYDFYYNATYSFDEEFFVALGLNVGAIMPGDSELSSSLGFGYQASVGYVFLKQWIVETQYRTMNFQESGITTYGSTLGTYEIDADFSGMNFMLKYVF